MTAAPPAARASRRPSKNATLTDQTGNVSGTITTDGNGYATFSVPARGYAVWVPTGGTTTPPPTGGTTTAVTFNVTYSNTVSGQDVYVVGSTAQLGSWNTASAIKLSGAAWPKWTGTVTLTSGTAVQYKYIRKDAAGNVLWEGGATAPSPPAAPPPPAPIPGSKQLTCIDKQKEAGQLTGLFLFR